jgi:hypothetical protein
MRYPSPDHNRATPKPIPLKNASVGEVFPTASIVRTKKSEPRLICEKDLSPLPHWKLSGTMCRQSNHATRATCTSERKTNVRSTSPQTKLVQSVSHSFWANVVITQVSKMNSPVLTWCRFARTSPSRTVCNPSSISQTTDKTLYGGNIHTKLQSNLLLPLTLH